MPRVKFRVTRSWPAWKIELPCDVWYVKPVAFLMSRLPAAFAG
jgi:hypothetical protein